MDNEEKIKELEKKVYELETTITDGSGNTYARRDHPTWNYQSGNPYIPLDQNGNMRKGYIG